MNRATSLPILLHELNLGSVSDEAYTLNRRVQITDTIVDGQFVFVTDKAARIYGRTVDQMRQTWQSLTQPLEAYTRSREISMARHHQHDMPAKYITHLSHPNGDIVSVVKDTIELTIDNTAHWLTRISLATESPDAPDSQSIQIPAHPLGYRQFGGLFCLHEVQSLLDVAQQEHNVLNEREKLATIVSQLIPQDKGISTVGTKISRNGEPLTFGKPVISLANGQRILECQSCGHVWTRGGKKGLPSRCASREKRCYDWQNTVEAPQEAST